METAARNVKELQGGTPATRREVKRVTLQQRVSLPKRLLSFREVRLHMFLVWQAGSCGIQVQIQGWSVSSL